MGVKGRPTKSQIRQNIVDILYFLGSGYGYDIFKIYKAIFPAVTMRSIYYHLNKGVETKEFKIETIKKEKGKYSWGSEVEKIYYALGPVAKPNINKRIKEYVDTLKK